MQIFYLISGELTVMAHATLFTNLTPFMLVLLRYALRQKVHRLENIGTIIAIFGCIITIKD
jgi:drug/metabolite transporter (DMT)-like permease